jgi:hypothetical protein
VVVGATLVVTDEDDGTRVVAGPEESTMNSSDAAPSTEPAPGDPAVWLTDSTDVPTTTASSFTALVTRQGCSGGVTGRVLRPGVVATDTEVIVRFSAEALGDGAHDCPSNDWVPYQVDIGQPLGDRALVDGECREGEQAKGTASCNEEAALGVRWRPQSGPVTPPLFSRVDTSSSTAHRSAIASGVMPDLVDVDLNTLGDGTGVLSELRQAIGPQQTITVASEAPEGTVVAQDPAPGTPLDGVRRGWSLTVSEGGPVVRFEELPQDVAAFAATLPGFESDQPLTSRATDAGQVYKTDQWLFGLDCAAVDQAYRTFADPRYDTACPGRIGAPGQ